MVELIRRGAGGVGDSWWTLAEDWWTGFTDWLASFAWDFSLLGLTGRSTCFKSSSRLLVLASAGVLIYLLIKFTVAEKQSPAAKIVVDEDENDQARVEPCRSK